MIKHPYFYFGLYICLYLFATFTLIVNSYYSYLAFVNDGQDLIIALGGSIGFAVISLAVGEFVLNPNCWGPMREAFQAFVKTFAKSTGWPTWLAVLTVGTTLSFFVFCLVWIYIKDWQTTWQGLTDGGSAGQHTLFICTMLIASPEITLRVAPSVKSMATHAGMIHWPKVIQQDIPVWESERLARQKRREARRNVANAAKGKGGNGGGGNGKQGNMW